MPKLLSCDRQQCMGSSWRGGLREPGFLIAHSRSRSLYKHDPDVIRRSSIRVIKAIIRSNLHAGMR